MSSRLKLTEKKLVKSFIVWALLFLIAFEGISVISRYVNEKKIHEGNFIAETDRILGRKTSNFQAFSATRVGVVITDKEWKILQSYEMGIDKGANIFKFLDKKTLETSDGNVVYLWESEATEANNDIMLRRVPQGSQVIYFFGDAYKINSIKRDMTLFLILDLFLLIPIWFLSRWHVRRVLKPVQENIDTMTHFVHDAGHELKTPLAIMSGNLQIMRDLPRIDYNLVEESLATIDTMNESIQGLLELADLKMPDKNTQTNITEIIDHEIRNVKNPLEVTINNHINKEMLVSASEQHLQILLRNIIENAVKYNKPNGKVDIFAKKDAIIVEDTGIGMAHEDLNRIFDRFYRINKNSSVTGSGIGMTLVDKILKLYNWEINIESELEKGTKITIHF